MRTITLVKQLMNYRPATYTDHQNIAQLHARSWQENYRGIWSDEYLNQHVSQGRLTVWQNRLQHPPENQHIIVSEDDGLLCGFTCVYANDDPVWGALIDNLHVIAEKKGHGIGKQLMKEAAKWIHNQKPDSPFYLWVFEKNHPARHFYDAVGGQPQAPELHVNSDGSQSMVIRYVWRNARLFFRE